MKDFFYKGIPLRRKSASGRYVRPFAYAPFQAPLCVAWNAFGGAPIANTFFSQKLHKKKPLRIKRAPVWIQKIGIEWLWRFIRQPSRIIRQLALPKYVLTLLFSKDKTKCTVTFTVEPEAAQGAQTVNVAGDFNSWSSTDTPLKKGKDGSFSVKIELEANREYQFRYLLDGCRWENDWTADKYIPAP